MRGIFIDSFAVRLLFCGSLRPCSLVKLSLQAHFHYKPENIVMLTDDSQNPMQNPTKQNILQAMQWLVRDARPNDSLFFHCEFRLSSATREF
jgi:hypothetical protein